MKYIFICFLFFTSLSLAEITAPSDTTRDRGKNTTTKERVKKDGGETRDAGYTYSSPEEDQSFIGQCFSSCLGGLFESAITSLFSSSSNQNQIAASADSAQENPGLSDSSYERPALMYADDLREKKVTVDTSEKMQHSYYRDYIQLGIAGGLITGSVSDEYADGGFSYRLSNSVFIHSFVISASFQQYFATGKPLYDYKTLMPDGYIKDVASSTQTSSIGFSIEASYMFDFSESTGLKLGLGGNYQTYKEQTDITRDIYVENAPQPISSKKITEVLEFSGFYPFLSADFYIFTSPDASFMFDIFTHYKIINREPAKVKSTPMDWNKVPGEFLLGIGIGFNIL